MGGSRALETKLFDFTRRLLSEVGYHGIFGIEWLHETTTDELYVIDFNARPFLSIGHLIDSGLNLPLLAYLELIGHDLDDVRPLPVLKRLLWMNVLRDSRTLRQCRNITLMAWLGSILRCHSFAVWNSADPGPWLHQSALMLREQWRKYSWRQESNQRFRPSE
jgi:predicted ATP-grasp superfamily ATP-dependent carboligase